MTENTAARAEAAARTKAERYRGCRELTVEARAELGDRELVVVSFTYDAEVWSAAGKTDETRTSWTRFLVDAAGRTSTAPKADRRPRARAAPRASR